MADGSSDEVLCRVDAIPDGGVLGVDPPDPLGLPLLLARKGNLVQGWLNVCPQGGRRMDRAPHLFDCEDGKLRCARHGAVFALWERGVCVEGPCRGASLVPVGVKLQNGWVVRA